MSGGQSVVITDVFARAGLEVPLLTERSYERLAGFFSIIGGSYRNPFDTSSTFLLAEDPISNLNSMLDVMDKDPNIDSVVLELLPVVRPLSDGAATAEPVLDVVSAFNERSRKPFVIIATSAFSDALSAETRDKLAQRGITSFSSFERAAGTLKKLSDCHRLRREISRN
jgi:acyl-CoA synthetase (NDP forming)